MTLKWWPQPPADAIDRFARDLHWRPPPNFGVKLPRPGAGPAAELPASSPERANGKQVSTFQSSVQAGSIVRRTRCGGRENVLSSGIVDWYVQPLVERPRKPTAVSAMRLGDSGGR